MKIVHSIIIITIILSMSFSFIFIYALEEQIRLDEKDTIIFNKINDDEKTRVFIFGSSHTMMLNSIEIENYLPEYNIDVYNLSKDNYSFEEILDDSNSIINANPAVVLLGVDINYFHYMRDDDVGTTRDIAERIDSCSPKLPEPQFYINQLFANDNVLSLHLENFDNPKLTMFKTFRNLVEIDTDGDNVDDSSISEKPITLKKMPIGVEVKDEVISFKGSQKQEAIEYLQEFYDIIGYTGTLKVIEQMKNTQYDDSEDLTIRIEHRWRQNIMNDSQIQDFIENRGIEKGMQNPISSQSSGFTLLEKLIEKLQKNSIQVVVFSTPYHKTIIEGNPCNVEIMDSILNKISSKYDIITHSFLSEFSYMPIFSDTEHLANLPEIHVYNEGIADILKLVLGK